jgi:hypothetical protein
MGVPPGESRDDSTRAEPDPLRLRFPPGHRQRWRPPKAQLGVSIQPAARIGFAAFAVLILMLSSSDLSDLRLPSSTFTTDSGGVAPSANATGYTPYLLNVSSFPLPSSTEREAPPCLSSPKLPWAPCR